MDKLILSQIPADELYSHLRIMMREEIAAAMNPEGKLLTGKQVDQLYGITKSTRINWQKKGDLKPIRKGHRNFFAVSELLPRK